MSNMSKTTEMKIVNAATKKFEPELSKIFARHSRVSEAFGQLMLLLMQNRRYGHLRVDQIADYILEPLTKGNILLSRPTEQFAGVNSVAVSATIWAKVSPQVEHEIKSQVSARQFPVQLSISDWNSGEIVWVLDIIAPNVDLIKTALVNFGREKVKDQMSIHPTLITALGADFIKGEFGRKSKSDVS